MISESCLVLLEFTFFDFALFVMRCTHVYSDFVMFLCDVHMCIASVFVMSQFFVQFFDFALFLTRCTHVYSDFSLFLMRCTHVYSDFALILMRCTYVRRRKRGKWRWKVDKDDSRMRSIRMIHVCLFAWSIRMFQHTTRRIVVKDYVFFIFPTMLRLFFSRNWNL
ncbi:hypothetical protein HanXRQr2_Chr08g0335981 [Helianthus annuus]|uniref:Uncharacterized protein n=1 Tax=Helianthus annuus TaxID=4232 RepID=A0A9K3IE10_HELAN|nr:hypothetical protein HanXRQr2_Chr08g0335981 [Helianthus annuus]KAJ0538665.1 hypothetical protein HanHA300_Chr08g0277531 [Helianthus annuus]KAJ0546596.1 hypothetical protein HanIR_Chr08g0362741 [Helianthus annuus]KAJ0553295.1 hypothetical protein HanHA89_Chr08g0294831 [Helianthus annuus]KAJ0722208.1 hypothetical protein HanOQP8_Chr08g0284091 [Helianthus annuus]